MQLPCCVGGTSDRERQDADAEKCQRENERKESSRNADAQALRGIILLGRTTKKGHRDAVALFQYPGWDASVPFLNGEPEDEPLHASGHPPNAPRKIPMAIRRHPPSTAARHTEQWVAPPTPVH